MMQIADKNPYNANFLRMGMILRGTSGKEFAEQIGVKSKQMYRYMSGEEPASDVMERICDVLQFPRNFFYRSGDFPERDPRYPPDMYVPLKPYLRSAELSTEPLRAQIVALLPLIPDDDLSALFAYMHEVADYPPNVTRFPAPRETAEDGDE